MFFKELEIAKFKESDKIIYVHKEDWNEYLEVISKFICIFGFLIFFKNKNLILVFHLFCLNFDLTYFIYFFYDVFYSFMM